MFETSACVLTSQHALFCCAKRKISSSRVGPLVLKGKIARLFGFEGHAFIVSSIINGYALRVCPKFFTARVFCPLVPEIPRV